MEPSVEIAHRFEGILQRCGATGRPDGLPHSDRVIYYIIAVRCEIDMNGFDSVLDQLLTAAELDFVCSSLEEIGEVGLANSWRRLALLLQSVGHKPSGGKPIRSLPQAIRNELEVLVRAATDGDRLWQLDEKLAIL